MPKQDECKKDPRQELQENLTNPLRNRVVAQDDDKFQQDITTVFKESLDLLLKKHRDYGPKNISLSPGGPLNGLRVRMWDKTARINNLIDSGRQDDAGFESIRDTFMDLMNYSAIALMVLDGNWPGSEPVQDKPSVVRNDSIPDVKPPGHSHNWRYERVLIEVNHHSLLNHLVREHEIQGTGSMNFPELLEAHKVAHNR